MKKAAYIGLGLTVLGIALMIAGYASGAKTEVYFEKNKVRTADRKNISEITETLSSFSAVDVDLTSSDIEFIAADGEPRIEFYSGRNIEWEIENDTLEINDGSEENFSIGVNLSFLFRNRNTNLIKVYLPENSELSEIDIKCTSGDARFFGVNSEYIRAEMISGDIIFENLVSNECRLRLVSGDAKLRMIDVNELFIANISGDCDVSGTVTVGRYEFTAGDIDLILSGSSDEYRKDINIFSGDLYINGKKSAGFERGKSDLPRRVKVDSTSGDVKLTFEDMK